MVKERRLLVINKLFLLLKFALFQVKIKVTLLKDLKDDLIRQKVNYASSIFLKMLQINQSADILYTLIYDNDIRCNNHFRIEHQCDDNRKYN